MIQQIHKGVKKIAKKTGHVYWANSKKIDRDDKKERRQYVVVRDDEKFVSVSKIRGYNDNAKNADRLYKLDKTKYPLTKASGVDRKVYKKRSDNGRLLRLDDKSVFDSKSSFKLSSHDTYRVRKHTGVDKIKGRRK